MGLRSRTIFSSPLVCWAILFNLIGFFTWGFGPLTFCCLLLVVLLLFKLSRGTLPSIMQRDLFPLPASEGSATVGFPLKLAFALVTLLLLLGFLQGLIVAPNDWLIDIGLNTYLATQALVDGLNPYATMAQAWYHIDVSTPHVEMRDEQVFMFGVPYYYGFPYFPVMVLSYTPFTLLIEGYDAIRWANLVLVVINVLALRSLVSSYDARYRARNRTLVVVVYLCIIVYGFEIFWHGIVDILLSALLLFCFVFLQRRQYLLAGLVLGLAQAAKLLPPPFVALCVMLFLLQRPGFWTFCFAYGISSLLLIAPFVALDPQAFASATILFYLTNHSVGDNTALWFFLPEWLQAPFLWLGYVLTLAMIPLFVRRPGADLADVLCASFACYLVFMAFSKMTHLNYLWSVYPLGCAAFAMLLSRVQDKHCKTALRAPV